jgi:hypothetical protein
MDDKEQVTLDIHPAPPKGKAAVVESSQEM